MSVTNAISSVIIVGALIAVAVAGAVDAARWISKGPALPPLILASVNIFGGFLVTRACWRCTRRKTRNERLNGRHRRLAYLVSGVLFILALQGLSSPGTSRARQPQRHDRHGHRRWSTTLLGRPASLDPVTWGLIAGGVAIGGSIGAVIARRVAMTAMPQLVAAFHSLVGLAAVSGGRRGALFAGRLSASAPKA